MVIDGFYDGDGVYNTRFMPDSLGGWSYTTDSNSTALKGWTGWIEVIAPSPGNRGSLRVRDTFHFGYADGTPYSPFGTTCYAWVHQSEERQQETLTALKASPFKQDSHVHLPQVVPVQPRRSPCVSRFLVKGTPTTTRALTPITSSISRTASSTCGHGPRPRGQPRHPLGLLRPRQLRAPIVVVLLLRYLGWSYDAEQPSSYLNSYAAILVIALCVSVASLALAAEFGPGHSAGKPFLGLLYADFKWGWPPALICLYVVYHVDRQIDPLLPDIGTLAGEGIPARLTSCLLFACAVTLFALLPTSSLSARPDFAWPVEKLHTVVTGTVFTIGFVMAFVSQFGLVKSSPRTSLAASLANPLLHAP